MYQAGNAAWQALSATNGDNYEYKGPLSQFRREMGLPPVTRKTRSRRICPPRDVERTRRRKREWWRKHRAKQRLDA